MTKTQKNFNFFFRGRILALRHSELLTRWAIVQAQNIRGTTVEALCHLHFFKGSSANSVWAQHMH